MSDKVKNKVVAIGFVLVLVLFFLINILKNDEKISNTERRTLAQFPEITVKKVINGDTSDQFEKYVTDQFIGRDTFRSIKSFFNINIFNQKDNNKLFIKDNAIYKIEYPLNENNVDKTAQKINNIYETYLQGMNVHYAIIPDKNYYLEDENYLKMDYLQLKQIMQETLKYMNYIDIWESLTLEDYYRTDTHWKQENLNEVVKVIQEGMNLEKIDVQYVEQEIGDFYGVYYGQLGLDVEPDKIKILNNEILEKCITYNWETQKQGQVYDMKKWEKSSDKYDIYLSGATPLISIENPNSSTEKELLLFRDSYGSSIAPLLINNYKKITLIDTRYISSKLLGEYVDFQEQDVLFLYNTLVLNQNILK